MSNIKRLFLFAGYDKDGIIDDALVYYIKTLSKFGDVILCMDSNCPVSELNKVNKYTIARMGRRHYEYDFGSYKRAYEYAKKHDILRNYDVLYLVNDSVYGPTIALNKTIANIEKLPTDASGMVVSKHKTHEFMESWFVRLNKNVFTSDWFDDFITSVTRQTDKTLVTIKYEHGLSNLIKNNGCTWSGVYEFHGRYTYNNPTKLFKKGCPFIKKSSFVRHNGALGFEINYVLKHCDKTASRAIINSANHTYTRKYVSWLLTKNPLSVFLRGAKYAIQKSRKK